MEVGYGSFLGKLFENSVGQLIKPDRINPDVTAAKNVYNEKRKETLSQNSVGGVQIDSKIIDFKNKHILSENSNLALQQKIKKAESENIGETGKLDNNSIDQSFTGEVEGVDNSKVGRVNLAKYQVLVDDADTLILKSKTNPFEKDIEIRLSGIDAPEISDHKKDPISFLRYAQNQLFGTEAKEIAKTLLANQNNLELLINKQEMSYGRYVGVVVGDDNKNLNLELLRKGAGTALPWGNEDIIGKRELSKAETQAKNSNQGIWQFSRYRAIDKFNSQTGAVQTHNTFTRIDRLAERPELAAYVTYLNNLGDQTGNLTEQQLNTLSSLAQAYTQASETFKEQRSLLNNYGIEQTQVPTNNYGLTGQANLDFKASMTYADRKLIKAGVLEAPPSPSFTPELQNISLGFQGLSDFTGIKGWAFNLALQEVNKPTIEQQLAKSGEATNAARSFKEMNLGDVGGVGEFQRKILGTSTAALPDTVNLLKNQMPNWLPKDQTSYFLDFSKGDPYSLVENGYSRLPGRGFEALHPELKGISPENYPLIYRYKILSDVAKGSREQFDTRRQIIDQYKKGRLSKREEDLLVETLDKEVARETRKKFREDKVKVDGVLGTLQNSLWNSLATVSNLNPLEMLTPWRPFDKFMHQRTAVEDYRATLHGGSDTAIWTNPYSYFIKPAFNKTRLLFDSNFKPVEAIEKNQIDEYFDKLGYLKSKLSGDRRNYENTVISSSLSGLNTNEKIKRFKNALNGDQKEYFDAFSKETNKSKREEILQLLPDDLKRAYLQIWRNVDIANKAKDSGGSVQKALAKDFLDTTYNLLSASSINSSLSKSEKEFINNSIESNRDSYANLGFSKNERFELAKAELLRERIATKEASSFVEAKTGTPNGLFAGWDPRLSIKDIKIRTLSIGKEDLRRFGFWQRDEERMSRLKALEGDDQVVTKINLIKREIDTERQLKQSIDQALFKNGFKADRIRFNDSAINEVIIRNNE